MAQKAADILAAWTGAPRTIAPEPLPLPGVRLADVQALRGRRLRVTMAGRGAFLDCRQAIGGRFPEAYPTVYAHCRAAGIDPVTDLIPVAPAAHYHMGGIATDMTGRTSVEGLWAAGEVASTGLHGANRLASNSLLEAVVLGGRVADDIRALVHASDATPIAALRLVDDLQDQVDRLQAEVEQLRSERAPRA